MAFFFYISFIIILRISELIYSRRNEKWLLRNQAKEYGAAHYPLIVLLHVFFILSLMIEYSMNKAQPLNILFLLSFFVLLSFKSWTIFSLGKFWNTKIYRIPSLPLVKKGPYKYFRHPNYIIVVLEIIIIPLVFSLFYTAFIFTFLNILVLFVRIKEENKALQLSGIK